MDIFSISFSKNILKILAFISAAVGFFGAAAMLMTGNIFLVVATFFGGLVSAAFIMAIVHIIALLERIALSLSQTTRQSISPNPIAPLPQSPEPSPRRDHGLVATRF